MDELLEYSDVYSHFPDKVSHQCYHRHKN